MLNLKFISLYEIQGFLTSGFILPLKLIQKSHIEKKIQGFLFFHPSNNWTEWLVQLSLWDQPNLLFLG